MSATSTVQSGVTSVAIDGELLESAAGIVIVDAENTVPPVSEDFQLGFAITNESDFTYEVDPFSPIGGIIQHSGIVNLTVDVGDPLPPQAISIGNFAIGFDESRISDNNSGFFLADTLEDNGLDILFEIGNPASAAVAETALDLNNADLNIAPEFAAIINSLTIEDLDLTGVDVGDASINALSTPTAESAGYFNFNQFAEFQLLDEGITIDVPPTEINGIRLSLLYDETYYLAENADVNDAIELGAFASGFEHFLAFGVNEGRNPSILFDEAFYLAQNGDVADAVNNNLIDSGLIHYLLFGSSEGRNPSALFNEIDYLTTNQDVLNAVVNGGFTSGFDHYIEFGAGEGRSPNLLLFQEQFYLNSNNDVADAVDGGFFASGFEHYVLFGQGEQRDPSSLFDESAYLAAHPDVANAVLVDAFSSGFEHYIKFGRAEGRLAVPVV